MSYRETMRNGRAFQGRAAGHERTQFVTALRMQCTTGRGARQGGVHYGGN